ncbi:MAG: DNA repair protein RadC [Bacilli bacterium]|nr:DNA repair protein RadC [Bacilli bacterium]
MENNINRGEEINIKFKEIPIDERPRERLIKYGVTNLSNEELLMIIIKTGTKKYSVKEISNNLINLSGGIINLKRITMNNLIKIPGIGKVKAIELMAIIELSKRMNEEVLIKDFITCTNPKTIIKYFNYLFKDKQQEEFYVIYLDNKKKYIDKIKLFIGSINKSIVHPREIFKNAYLLSASYIICIHNHPSGDATPSKEDITFTKSLYNISNLHAIYLIDHIIIGNNNYYSFFEDNNIITHIKK